MAKSERRRRIPSPRRCRSGKNTVDSGAEAARGRSAGGGCSRAEREDEGAGVEELLVKSEFTPRPSQKGARSLRPEIPARGRNFRPAARETSRIKCHTQKLDTSDRKQWFRDKLGLRTRYQAVLIWYDTHVCKM